MADEPANPPNPDDDADALETPDADENALETTSTDQSASSTDATSVNTPAEPSGKQKRKGKLRKFNIYLLLFLLIIVIAGVIIGVAYFQSKKQATTSTLKTQELTKNALQQIASSDATVGSSQAVLNVQSSAIFAGKVLIRDDLQVAGSLQIGGTVGLSNITVSGATQLAGTQITKDLAVTGNTSIQGATNIAKSLQVNGTGSFSGNLSAPQLTVNSLQLGSDLVLTHHLVTGGGTPTRSNGSALGSGGSSSNSGSDTAGSVSVNVGGSPAAGCFITVNFVTKYNTVPHVLITPIGSAAGELDYYVTRTSSNFSICDATPAPAGSSFGFDYFVVN